MTRRVAPPVSSILCPVDFSPHAAAALRYAARIAHDTGSALTVLFVNDPLLVTAAAIKFDEETIEHQALAELDRFVGRTIGRVATVRRASTGSSAARERPRRRRQAAVRIEQATGDPATEILNAARRLDCDLIVIGTEGLGGLRKFLFGSTTHQVVRQTRVPVVLVDRATRIGAPDRPWPGKRLLVPLDLGRRAEHDVERAVALARYARAAIVFVHVVVPVQPPPWYAGDRSMLERLQATRARTQLAALAAKIGYPAETRIMRGTPATMIAAAARETRCDLVVMGVRGGDGLLHARPGSIAYEVVRQVRVPVFVLPARPGRRDRRRRG